MTADLLDVGVDVLYSERPLWTVSDGFFGDS
jgi:hypothetical protein